MRVRELLAGVVVMLAGSVLGAILGYLNYEGVDVDI